MILYRLGEDMDLNNAYRTNEDRNDMLTTEEREVYLAYIRRKYPNLDPDTVTIEPKGDFVNISFQTHRRIATKMGGTLIGDPDTWNAAKRAEYYDTLPNPLE